MSFVIYSQDVKLSQRNWGNLCVRLKELGATGERVRQTPIFLGLLFIDTLFVVSGKAQNHHINYRRNWALPQIPKTQTPLGYAVPIVTSCYREHPELAEVCRPESLWEAAVVSNILEGWPEQD